MPSGPSTHYTFAPSQRLIDDGVITKVVAYELSRIARDVGDQADFFKRLAGDPRRLEPAPAQADPATGTRRP